MNLLLAEDDPVSRAFLLEVLRDAGHQVSACADGLSALAAATESTFDLLLLDLNLPALRADQLLIQLRSNPAAASGSVAAIVLTADLDPSRRRDLLAAGFAGAAAKPLSAAELLSLVAGQLRTSASHVAPGEQIAPTWDDEAALRALGGNRRALDSLRGLLRLELPGQRERLRVALVAGNYALACDEIHRLRAACGFCGAAHLGATAAAIGASIDAGGIPSATDIDALDGAFVAALALEPPSTAA